MDEPEHKYREKLKTPLDIDEMLKIHDYVRRKGGVTEKELKRFLKSNTYANDERINRMVKQLIDEEILYNIDGEFHTGG